MRRAHRTLCRSISSVVSSLITRLRHHRQAFGGLGDVEPSVSRAIISGAAIGSLAENFNRRNPMPSQELAGDVFNNIVIVHDCQNNSLRYSLLRLAAETWLIGRMSSKLYELLWLGA